MVCDWLGRAGGAPSRHDLIEHAERQRCVAQHEVMERTDVETLTETFPSAAVNAAFTGVNATAAIHGGKIMRPVGLVAGAVYLARGALADAGGAERVALARFMAENLLAETAGLKRQVIEGAASLQAAAGAVFGAGVAA